MDKVADHLGYFVGKHKDIYEAYANYGKLIHEVGGPLDEKTRALIKVAVSATSGHSFALGTHIKKALKASCTPDEIEHVLLLTAPSVGFPNMMESLLVFREIMELK